MLEREEYPTSGWTYEWSTKNRGYGGNTYIHIGKLPYKDNKEIYITGQDKYGQEFSISMSIDECEELALSLQHTVIEFKQEIADGKYDDD